MEINNLKILLKVSWTKETCSPGLKDKWCDDNPSLGQCAVTALIVNDFFGGKIMRCMTSSGSHYYNLINDEIVDFTSDQFVGEIPKYEEGKERTRDYLLSNDDTKNRYIILLNNLKKAIKKYKYKEYKLIDCNGMEYLSSVPGIIGGNRKLKIYGKLDCPSAKRWIDKGFYKKNRVFFENEETAILAGYRPCAVCMPNEYKEWKKKNLKLK